MSKLAVKKNNAIQIADRISGDVVVEAVSRRHDIGGCCCGDLPIAAPDHASLQSRSVQRQIPLHHDARFQKSIYLAS